LLQLVNPCPACTDGCGTGRHPVALLPEGDHYGLVWTASPERARELLALDDAGKLSVHSTERACPGCGRSFDELDPKLFSYNSARGWCPKCRGFGELFYLPDVDRGANADSIEESWFGWQEGKREICPECKRKNEVPKMVSLFQEEGSDDHR